MARKPSANPLYEGFARLLDEHLRNGTRPEPAAPEPWSNRAFAALMPGRDPGTVGAAENTVANWRNGTALPGAIEPILRALFGPPRTDGGPARAALRDAYIGARLARERGIAAAAEPDPAGEAFVPEGEDRLGIKPDPPETDAAAAAEPEVIQDHPLALEAARALAELAARRGNQLTDAWSDLLPAARQLAAALEGETAALPGRLGAAHQASVRLGVLLETQARLLDRPEPGDSPLDAELFGRLRVTVTTTAPMLRAFPSVQRRDGRLRDFLQPDDLANARPIAAAAEAQEVLSPEAGERIAGWRAAAGRAGPQGEKATGRFVATVRNAVLAGAVSLVMAGYANESPLIRRISGWFVAVEQEIAGIVEGMAPDVSGTIRFATELAKDGPGADGVPAERPAPSLFPPLTPLARWREPVPGLPEVAWPDMVTLPAGRFLMGAPEGEEGSSDRERPQREVTVERPFALGRVAVTFAQWDEAVAAGFVPPRGSAVPEDRGWGRGDRPVIDVSWEAAQDYCSWLNHRLGLLVGTYRLPSEAEWEYGCRAGTVTAFSFGHRITKKQVNYAGKRTVLVGSLRANAWGLHEMHGNVWEWCEDLFGPYPDHPTDSRTLTPSDSSLRVLRGGSWGSYPRYCRSASRSRYRPDDRISQLGFRLARTLF